VRRALAGLAVLVVVGGTLLLVLARVRDEAPDAARPGGAALAIGITEPNPNLVWPRGAHPVPDPFARWRDALARIHPDYYRLVVDWRTLQPERDAPPDLDRPQSGCMRAKGPCAGWRGLREQLRALAARQREGGWEGLAVLTGSPSWAARAPGGCERPGTQARSRAPYALGAYRRLVRDVLAAAREAGAALRWWSPWNEPNHPYFLSPQRITCEPGERSAATGAYARLARALQAELARAPGEQELVLGELAGVRRAKADVTGVEEFVAGLPRGLVCAVPVWGQHLYAGGQDPLPGVKRALAAHGCGREHAIWVTETGIRLGSGRLGNRLEEGAEAAVALDRACPAVAAQLRRLHADPQVTAAFQYTLREDDRFRTGLVTTALDRAYPVLGLWEAWGAGARPSADDPPPPARACAH